MARRIEVLKAPNVQALAAGRHEYAKTVAVKDGDVTWVDKVKGYYKALIALVGAVLVGVTQLSGAVPAEAEPWVTVAISTLTVIGVILRANEQWVNDL